ncbi:hypothetical protein FSOLCH5_015316 [Fusarium solani]
MSARSERFVPWTTAPLVDDAVECIRNFAALGRLPQTAENGDSSKIICRIRTAAVRARANGNPKLTATSNESAIALG